MKMNLKSGKTGTIILLTFFLFLTGCNQGTKTTSLNDTSANTEAVFKVTFIVLGSVRCIPCQQMQTVMKSIEQKYASQVKVIFYDVWTDAGSPYGKQYGINAIPTQIFLDETGKEYFRHEGFFPEEELVKILNQKGVK